MAIIIGDGGCSGVQNAFPQKFGQVVGGVAVRKLASIAVLQMSGEPGKGVGVDVENVSDLMGHFYFIV